MMGDLLTFIWQDFLSPPEYLHQHVYLSYWCYTITVPAECDTHCATVHIGVFSQALT